MDYAPTHYGYVSFFDSDYRIDFKEVHTGFRPTLEIVRIQSSPQPGVTVWHPCIPFDKRQPTWYVGKHLMAAHEIKGWDNFFKYTISYRLDGRLCRMGLRRITDDV
jgi:hypothetical protein